MWSLMAAPLIFSGDMAKLDAFTLNVLCNHEIIEVNQDLLGKQAKIIRNTETEFVLAKDLEDGSIAVGLFNLKDEEASLAISWDELMISGERVVRDLWRQENIETYNNSFATQVAPHGVMMLRLLPSS
jgi:alpha-galactosidase